MKREWKPGDVVMLENHGGIPAVRAAKKCRIEGHNYAGGDHWHYLTNLGGATWDSNGDRKARPLVVIDPEDAPNEPRRFLEHLSRTWAAQAPHEFKLYGGTRLLDWLASHFPTPKPPKPEEPTGLGAVVEDGEGAHWVLYTHPTSTAPWTDGGTSVEWDDVDAVRVLSEGVQA